MSPYKPNVPSTQVFVLMFVKPNFKKRFWMVHTHTHTHWKSHKYSIENYNNEKSKLKETQLSAKMDLILNNVTNNKQTYCYGIN
jgi:hypothetical protein